MNASGLQANQLCYEHIIEDKDWEQKEYEIQLK
jgi:hypothetical protein